MYPEPTRRARLIRAGCIGYVEGWNLQRRLAAEVCAGADEALLLCSHPPTITLGRRATESQLRWSREKLEALGVRVVETDRGGGATLHSPGQLVGYPILRLGRSPDLHRLLRGMEATLIRTLRSVGIPGERRCGFTGVWVGTQKIASIGMRFEKGVTLHGFALNVSNDIGLFDSIVPCGLTDVRMTSVRRLCARAPDLGTLELGVAEALALEFGLGFEEQILALPAEAYGLQ
ncbi:MAG: lipoyl(octanoyl) transferase LipB [Acidobacteriota bacterium]